MRTVETLHQNVEKVSKSKYMEQVCSPDCITGLDEKSPIMGADDSEKLKIHRKNGSAPNILCYERAKLTLSTNRDLHLVARVKK